MIERWPTRYLQGLRTGQFGGVSVSKSWPPVRRWRDQISPLTTAERSNAHPPPYDKCFAFICGLHRSGTTLLARILAEHPDVSGFSGTGAIEDEGQFLQSVYPVARRYGGVGRFGFSQAMHMTENSPLVSDNARRLLFTEWSRYWDLSCPVLLEKSPPNILKARFLQAMFPCSRFIIVLRHPIATSLSTRKGSHTSPSNLLSHWLHCYEVLVKDVPHLANVIFIRYEDLIVNTVKETERLHNFLRIPPLPPNERIRGGVNDLYFKEWESLGRVSFYGSQRKDVERRFEQRVKMFGYSLSDRDHVESQDAVFDRLTSGNRSIGAACRTRA